MCHRITFFWNSIFQTHRVLLQKLKPCFAYQNSISNLGCCLGFNKRTDHKRFRNNKTPLGQTPPLRGVGQRLRCPTAIHFEGVGRENGMGEQQGGLLDTTRQILPLLNMLYNVVFRR